MTLRTLPAAPGVTCVLHAYHSPEVVSFDVHHVIPISMGGPDIATNRIIVCPTGHRNVHTLIHALTSGDEVHATDWGRTTWDYAHRALDA
jgi:hypothetical protein